MLHKKKSLCGFMPSPGFPGITIPLMQDVSFPASGGFVGNPGHIADDVSALACFGEEMCHLVASGFMAFIRCPVLPERDMEEHRRIHLMSGLGCHPAAGRRELSRHTR